MIHYAAGHCLRLWPSCTVYTLNMRITFLLFLYLAIALMMINLQTRAANRSLEPDIGDQREWRP